MEKQFLLFSVRNSGNFIIPGFIFFFSFQSQNVLKLVLPCLIHLTILKVPTSWIIIIPNDRSMKFRIQYQVAKGKVTLIVKKIFSFEKKTKLHFFWASLTHFILGLLLFLVGFSPIVLIYKVCSYKKKCKYGYRLNYSHEKSSYLNVFYIFCKKVCCILFDIALTCSLVNEVFINGGDFLYFP